MSDMGPAESGDDPVYGARPLKRMIQQSLQHSLANKIFAGRFNEGTTIHVDATRDGFVFTEQLVGERVDS